jgi:hypothetical protein
MRIYKRIIHVIIGDTTGDAVSIDSLFMTIEIKRELSSKPAEGTIKIYNLSETTEKRIGVKNDAKNNSKSKRIQIFVGYDGKEILIHDGDIRRIESQREGLDRITVVTLGGNLYKLTNAIFNKSYKGQVKIKQIVTDALPSFELESLGLDVIPDNAMTNNFSYTGRTADLLNKLLRPLKIQWHEDNGFVKFNKNGDNTRTAVLLTRDTGLIGSAGLYTKDTEKGTETGVKFKSVMNGLITIGCLVKIESIIINGLFKVTQLCYKGDNREGDFVVECLGSFAQ